MLTGRTEYDGSDVEVAVARLSRRPNVPEEHGPAWQQLLTAINFAQQYGRSVGGREKPILSRRNDRELQKRTPQHTLLAPVPKVWPWESHHRLRRRAPGD